MRRFLSISLLLLFMLPLVSPLFATSITEADIPACCRRSGKHHCVMSTAAQGPSSSTVNSSALNLRERCPYNLTAPIVINLPFVSDEIRTAIFAGVLSQPAYHAQTEVCPHTSRDRSHQKRGPPVLILSQS